MSVGSALGLVIPVGRPANQALEVGVNRLIALAAGVLEAFDIENMDATASIIDETSFLKFAGYWGAARIIETPG